jgi:hypothetical protein
MIGKRLIDVMSHDIFCAGAAIFIKWAAIHLIAAMGSSCCK